MARRRGRGRGGGGALRGPRGQVRGNHRATILDEWKSKRLCCRKRARGCISSGGSVLRAVFLPVDAAQWRREDRGPAREPGGRPGWELEGAQIAIFAGPLFQTMRTRTARQRPSAHPAPDGRYPKADDLETWKKVSRQKDAWAATVDMREYGSGPADDLEARYRKRTWLATRVRGLQVVARRCQGHHRHAELKGVDTFTGCKWTAEAGRCAQELLKRLADIIIRGRWRWARICRAARGSRANQGSRGRRRGGGGELNW